MLRQGSVISHDRLAKSILSLVCSGYCDKCLVRVLDIHMTPSGNFPVVARMRRKGLYPGRSVNLHAIFSSGDPRRLSEIDVHRWYGSTPCVPPSPNTTKECDIGFRWYHLAPTSECSTHLKKLGITMDGQDRRQSDGTAPMYSRPLYRSF